MADDKLTQMIMERFDRPISDTGMKNRIVVWSDPTMESKEDVENLVLDGITILIWDGYNSFQIKERVECEEPDEKFLIYMPGPLPDPSQNILMDIIAYSKPLFSADKASRICLEVGISEDLKKIVQEHDGFFKYSKNRQKIQRYAPFDDESILRSMMAVTVSSDNNDFDSIIIKVISDYSESPNSDKADEIIAIFDRNKLLDVFWDYCRREYGFEGDSIENLVRDMLITAAFEGNDAIDQTKLSKYSLSKVVRVSSMINRLLKETEYDDDIINLCTIISEQYSIKAIISALDGVEPLMSFDIFSCVDSLIIERYMQRILSTQSPLNEKDMEHLEKRLKMHGGRRFGPFYDALSSASELMSLCTVYSNMRSRLDNTESIIKEYTSELYKIDMLYRHFIDWMDNAPSDFEISEDILANFMQFIENTYCNVFLNPIVMDLCSHIDKYTSLPGPYQMDFCRKYIDENRKTVVIISDAFRYECAAELRDILGTTSRVEKCDLDYMISTVPSKTSFGMAALLPNNGLDVKLDKDGKFAVLIQGQATESSFREKILQSRYPDSIVLTYEMFKTNTSTELRRRCEGKKLIYVYHDSIDKTGESDERNVFEACDRAMDEIKEIITKITNWNYTKFIVTSDHGFIYRRSEIGEYDKISTIKEFNSKRRFALNDKPFSLDRCVEFSLDYLGTSNDGLFVSVPNSIALFRRQGGVKCYAHEGISPQEVVVPVLTINTMKGAVIEKYVGLKPGSKREVKQNNPRFELWQESPVNSEYRKCDYELWLEDKDGRIVSQTYLVAADSDDPSDLRHNLTMKEELKIEVINLVIRRKGNSDEDRFEFRVKTIGYI